MMLHELRAGGEHTGVLSTLSIFGALSCLFHWSQPRGAATRPCPTTARPGPTWRTCRSCALMSTKGTMQESWLHGVVFLPAMRKWLLVVAFSCA